MPAFEVVIAGGGVAALETALAAHELGGEKLRLTLLAPASDFVYRPMAVLEPFAPAAAAGPVAVHGRARRGARAGRRGLGRPRPTDRPHPRTARASLRRTDDRRRGQDHRGGHGRGHDGLRARGREPGRLDPSDRRRLRSHARVRGPRPTWPLPVYEVALLCAEHARDHGAELEITILTAEQRPLGVFGDEVSAGVAGLLAHADIAVIGDASAERSAAGLIVNGGGRELQFDRVAAIPRLEGPAITGLPADADGFLPITERGLVVGTESVYAAGDAADFSVKFGAVAAQQADAAAAAIAAAAGADVEAEPFDGVIHGALLSGQDRGRLYFTARLDRDGARDARVSDTPTRPPEAKIAARYLVRIWTGSGPRVLAGSLAN